MKCFRPSLGDPGPGGLSQARGGGRSSGPQALRPAVPVPRLPAWRAMSGEWFWGSARAVLWSPHPCVGRVTSDHSRHRQFSDPALQRRQQESFPSGFPDPSLWDVTRYIRRRDQYPFLNLEMYVRRQDMEIPASWPCVGAILHPPIALKISFMMYSLKLMFLLTSVHLPGTQELVREDREGSDPSAP